VNGPIHPSQSVYHCRIVSFLLRLRLNQVGLGSSLTIVSHVRIDPNSAPRAHDSPVQRIIQIVDSFFSSDPQPASKTEQARVCGELVGRHLLNLIAACGELNLSRPVQSLRAPDSDTPLFAECSPGTGDFAGSRLAERPVFGPRSAQLWRTGWSPTRSTPHDIRDLQPKFFKWWEDSHKVHLRRHRCFSRAYLDSSASRNAELHIDCG
jgi:hypothetical protein